MDFFPLEMPKKFLQDLFSVRFVYHEFCGILNSNGKRSKRLKVRIRNFSRR